MSKKILIPLMNGFEETEFIAVRDVLIREGIDVDSISLTGEKIITANHNTLIGSDMVFGKQNIDLNDYSGIFIPGGSIGVENLDKNLYFDNFINEFYSENKIIAAICAAPILLAKRGILKNKKAVVYPNNDFIKILEKNGSKYVDDKIFYIDHNVITGKDFASSIEFGYALADLINNWNPTDLKQ